MKKHLLILFAFSIGHLSSAQAPLLPVLKDSTIWNTSVWRRGGVLGIVTEETSYKVSGDTIIGGHTFKFIQSTTKHCDKSASYPIIYCDTVSVTQLVGQFGNTIVTSKNDTLFSMRGTQVGDSVLYDSKGMKITKIDSINFRSSKIRLFTLEEENEYYAYYADGIGIVYARPFPGLSEDISTEKYSSLTCYQTANGESYAYSPSDTTFVQTTTGCMILLSIDPEESATPINIFVNEQNELIIETAASQVDVYNSLGQHVLTGQNTQKTDLNGLKSGVYMASVLSGNRQSKYKFFLK